MSAAEAELVTLPNGVRIALDHMPGLETAALGAWLGVGARWESAEHNGIAHLFEHMAFKGAGGRDAKTFAEAIENVGGFLNAATSHERTSYTARVTREHAPFAFDLIADMILSPHWLEEDLEKEKGVVAQERGEAFDQPDDRVFELHQGAVHPDHPLGRPILGLEETVASIRVADLAAFRDAHLAPHRIVLCVAGGYERAAVLEAVERRFGGLGAPPAVHALPARPVAGGAAEARKLEQLHLTLSFPAPPAGAEEGPALWILSEIFGGGMASRLFQDIREERGLVYAIHSWIDAYEDAGRLGVYAGCAAAKAREVAERVGDAIQALAERGVASSELARAKAVVTAQMLMGMEAPAARTEAHANQVLLRGRLAPFAELRARIAAVTEEDVAALARRACAGGGAAAAVGPKTGLAAVTRFQARFP